MPAPILDATVTRLRIRVIVAATFVAQLIAGLTKGAGFVDDGYSFYAGMAATFLEGHGFCYSAGELCTSRMPLYPLIVAPFLYTHTAYPGLIVLQALVGASIAWLTYRIGASLFNARIGLVAAALAGLNPYAVIHYPTFQDTVVVNALIAAAVLCLLQSTKQRNGLLAIAGAALALAVLTNARVAFLVPFMAAWALWSSASSMRIRRTALFVLPLLLMLGGWMYRNYSIDGTAVLTSESGRSLWIANNATTFSFYPNRSIDEVADVESETLDAADKASISVADPIQRDRALSALGWKYISSHPVQTIANAGFKVAVAFSGWLSPARGWLIQLGFAALFLPTTVAALAMLWRLRRDDESHVLIGLIVVAFSVTTAIYWAHTSHQSYLHPFYFIYACAAISRLRSR